MFFPESLYLLSSRDQQVTWLDPVFNRQTLTSNSAGISTPNYTVPESRALILQNVSSFGTPGAATQCTSLDMRAQGPDGQDMTISIGFPSAAPPVLQSLVWNWNGSLLIPPRWNIYTRASFTGAAAANTAAQTLIGVLIPVANIQRV